MGATGAIQVRLASFGRFQTGTTIQAPVYFPVNGNNGCNLSHLNIGKHMQKALDDDAKRGFLLLLDGDCTYEEKARFAEKVGAQALIIYEQ